MWLLPSLLLRKPALRGVFYRNRAGLKDSRVEMKAIGSDGVGMQILMDDLLDHGHYSSNNDPRILGKSTLRMGVAKKGEMQL